MLKIHIVEEEQDFDKISPLLIELQKQHADVYPTLFRDFRNLDFFKDLSEKFMTEEDYIRAEKGLDIFLYFEQDEKIVGCAFVQDKIRKDNIAFVNSHQLFGTCFIIDANYRNQGVGKNVLRS